MGKQKRILIIRTDKVGDVIMITPLVRELRKTFPDSYISVLVNPAVADVFKHNPNINSIISDDLTNESFWDVVREIKERNFSHGLLVFPTERAAFQMLWGGVRKRFMTGYRLYSLITLCKGVSRNKYRNIKHEADYCMDLARRIGVETNNIKVELFISEDEKIKAEQILLDNGISLNSFKIFLHTGSGLSAPNWSEEKYYNLIKEIVKKYNNKNFSLILTAREMSEDFLKKIKNINDKRIFDLSKALISLRDLIICISKADLFISSSTGAAHIADALDIKSIVIHCHRNVSSAKHWGILNEKSINLEVSKEFCDANCSSDKKICMIEEGLKVEDVLNNIIIS